MSAITTVLLEFLRPGDLLVYSKPLYGGSDHFIKHILPDFGIHTVGIHSDHTQEEIIKKISETDAQNRLKLIFIETPANPTNAIIDISMCRKIADHFSTESNTPVLAVDNTYMGPLWSHPLQLGADLVLYSATKYIGGHSDVIAGACLGSKELMGRIKVLRTFLGNMAGPWTGWLLMRSLETLKPRMETQAINAKHVADYLMNHPHVEKVFYLGHLKLGSQQHDIFNRQYSSAGAMISFNIKGGEKEAFTFLNRLKLFHLAVSLGSTESLAQHPFTMTHADVASDEKKALGLTQKLIRLSIGIENSDDLIWDISQALENK
jgi:methionine-gamma-lyase